MSGFRELVEAISKGDKISESSPKGWEGTVKAMKGKKDIDNPYALAHYMKKKGYKSRQTESTVRPAFVNTIVEHPVNGRGKVVSIDDNKVVVEWNRLDKKPLGKGMFTFSEAYSNLVIETYSDDPDDASIDQKKKKKKKKSRTDEAMAAIPNVYLIGNDNADEFVFDLTAEDIGLYEDDDIGFGSSNSDRGMVSSSSEDDFDEGTSSPLSVEGGYENATDDGPREMDSMPDDALTVPDYKEMDDPGKGNKRKVKRGGKKAIRNTDNDSSDEIKDEEPDFMKKKTNEGLTLADFDTEGMLTESNVRDIVRLRQLNESMDQDFDADLESDAAMTETHDPSSEIAMTREMAVKLFTAIASQTPDAGMIDKIVDGMIAVGAEKGETLDVEDIGSCMAKIKGEAGDDMDGDMDDDLEADDEAEFEDRAAGDGEPAGDEAGEEHTGKTKLMATEGEDEDLDECDDEELGETDDEDEDDEDEKLDESRVAMGMSAIKGTDRGGSILDDLVLEDEDEDDIAMIARRSGLENYWKHK